MPVTPQLLQQIKTYESQGYTPDEIVSGIKASGKYGDVVSQIDTYATAGYKPEEMLAGIRQSAPQPEKSKPSPLLPAELSEQFMAENPNLTGMYGAARSLVRPLLETGTQIGTGVATSMIPVAGPYLAPVAAGTAYAGGKRASDYLLGEESKGSVAGDIAFGTATELGGNLVAKGVAKYVPQSMIDWAYGSAMKFGKGMNKALTPKARQELIDYGLKEGAVPSESTNMIGKWLGFKGNKQLIDNLDMFDTQVKSAIDAADNAGGTVKSSEIVTRLDDLITQGNKVKKVDPEFLAEIQKVKNEFLSGADEIPVKDAQALKQFIYKKYQSFYGMPSQVDTLIQGKKAIARGIKEEIEAAVPEIKNLNMGESELLNFLDPYSRAFRRISDRDLMSFGVQMAPVAGKALGGDVMSTVSTVAKILEQPTIKSRLAILANRAKQSGTSQVRKAVGQGSKLGVNYMMQTPNIADTSYMNPMEASLLGR